MENLILVMHVLTAVAMIGLILIQQGKGADMGASFGSGSSQTVFGSAGAAGFLTKLTAGLALFFFVTSMSLAIIAKKRAHELAAPVVAAPVEKAPVAPVAPKPASSDVPAPVASAPVAVTPAPSAPAVPVSGASNPPANPVK